ncbi:MAG: hypothetical protein HZB36_08360 [Candidatus Omnitrophica bacterium]|nr:hypothetical protein [Candidatus Omnitrophota bacterium]
MLIVIVIAILAIIFAYELRHRMTAEQLTYLNRETRRLDLEVKKLKEDFEKKQEAETKKGFKLPFFPA